jgi:hypothetical protein
MGVRGAVEPTAGSERRVTRRAVLGMLGGAALAAACSSPKPTAGPGATLNPVPGDQRIPQAVLTDAEQGYAGTWKATWKDSRGGSGSAQVTAQIDPAGRTGSVSLDLSDGLFGQGSVGTKGTVWGSLDVVAYEKPPYTIPTPVLGTVTLTGPGYGYVQIATTSIPGQPDVASFIAKGFLTGPDILPDGSLPFTYTIVLKDGSKITGSAAFAQA